ncbi:hypothetical protein ACWCP8_16095 [Streptomyces sp. NPDC002206]
MACDSLMAAEIVVASGADCAKVIRADLKNNSDLLWALRGAGNGNFGIVTSLTYKAAPLRSVAYVQATWDGIEDLRGVFDAWQRTAPRADNRLGTQLEIQGFGAASTAAARSLPTEKAVGRVFREGRTRPTAQRRHRRAKSDLRRS